MLQGCCPLWAPPPPKKKKRTFFFSSHGKCENKEASIFHTLSSCFPCMPILCSCIPSFAIHFPQVSIYCPPIFHEVSIHCPATFHPFSMKFSSIFHNPFPSTFPFISPHVPYRHGQRPLHAPSTFHPASMKFPSIFQTFAIHFQSPFPSFPHTFLNGVDSTPCIDCIIRSNVRHGCSIVAPCCNPFSIHSINAFFRNFASIVHTFAIHPLSLHFPHFFNISINFASFLPILCPPHSIQPFPMNCLYAFLSLFVPAVRFPSRSARAFSMHLGFSPVPSSFSCNSFDIHFPDINCAHISIHPLSLHFPHCFHQRPFISINFASFLSILFPAHSIQPFPMNCLYAFLSLFAPAVRLSSRSARAFSMHLGFSPVPSSFSCNSFDIHLPNISDLFPFTFPFISPHVPDRRGQHPLIDCIEAMSAMDAQLLHPVAILFPFIPSMHFPGTCHQLSTHFPSIPFPSISRFFFMHAPSFPSILHPFCPSFFQPIP